MFANTGVYALLLGAFAAVNTNVNVHVNAVKDDEYYRAGMGNPNVDLKMYWADARNVLEDLDQFSYLYVQYHNCAWTQNRNHYYGDDDESGSGDETDYWYIDATPTYAANVAFSLYGSLTGESFSGCNENTFINSFTTNSGFEAFASAIYYAGASSSDYSQSYSSECAGGAGVACDYNIGFGYASYSTDTCDPYYSTGVSDSMGSLNSAFQSAQCLQIYDGSSNSNNYNNRNLKEEQQKQNKGGDEDNKNGHENSNNENENKNSDNNNNNNEDRNLQNNYGYGYGYNNGYNNGYNSYNSYSSNYYNYAGTALSVLYYSNACFIQNYWAPDGGCPDPFGRLQFYQQNFNKGVRMSMKVDTYVTYRANMAVGKKNVKIGAILFMAAMVLFISEQIMTHRLKKRKIKTSSGKGGSAELKKKQRSTRKKRSVVGLVSSTGGKIKNATTNGVKKVVARVANKAKCTTGDEVADDVFEDEGKDGIMVVEKKTPEVNKIPPYKAPKTEPKQPSVVADAEA